MLFFKNKYLIAIYDYSGENLEDVIISKKDREKFFKNLGERANESDLFCKLIKRHKQEFPIIKSERLNKTFYFIDVFESHNDLFNECDKKFLQECFVEDICEKRKKYKICKQYLLKMAKNYKVENLPLNGVNLHEIKSADKTLDTISKNR